MNIIFMGTPDFAVPCLRTLLESRHTISAVVTAPDKERGRGQKVSFSPVKQFAVDNSIPVLQPEKLKDDNFISELKSFSPELFVIVAFRILPKEVFTIPVNGSFNLHASLLPKYRGAAPIHWAVINGEKETGVTTFKLAEKVDTGNIYLKEKIPIEPEDNLGTMYEKLSRLGAGAVLRTVEMIDSGNYQLQPQDDSLASPAPKITKETGLINWNQPAAAVVNLVRGLSPSPGAYFIHQNKTFKIYKAAELSNLSLKPGEIYQAGDLLAVGSGAGAVQIVEIQQEGRKRMDAASFLRGYSFV